MIVEILFASIWAICGVVLVGSLLQLHRFLKTKPSIADEASFARFKALARTEMYLALFMLSLSPLIFVASAALVFKNGLPGLAAALITSAVFLGCSMYHKRIERRTHNLPVAEALEEAYRAVCNTWIKKPWPDF